MSWFPDGVLENRGEVPTYGKRNPYSTQIVCIEHFVGAAQEFNHHINLLGIWSFKEREGEY